MTYKINLDGVNYELDAISDQTKETVLSLQFTIQRIEELTNMQALLQRAKNSYIDSIKKEMLSKKAGFLFDDNH